jgi:parallel beta-helix repeat protein
VVAFLTRRDLVGQAVAAGTATIPLTNASSGETGRALADHPQQLDNAVVIGLFLQSGGMRLPQDCKIVCTRGHSTPGIGPGCYLYDPHVDARYVATRPRTSFIDAQSRGFRLATQTVDVRQAGAIGNGKADDTAACQEAMDAVESAGGGVVVLPTGEYKITSPLRLPARVGLQGCGQQSLLRAHGCHGIVIERSDVIGPRRVSDFSIQGESCEQKCAVLCDLGDDARAQGLVFENVYLSFFGTAISGRGFWHTTFRTISIHQVWRGIYLYDRNVKITVDDCRVTHGGLLKGEGTSIGVQVGDGASRFRPEDVQIDKSIIYGFDKAVVWRTALFGGVRNCDLDACTKLGLELVTADGGFTFRDNWVQVDGDAVRGVECSAVGYDPQLTNVLIANNRINTNKASGDSYGIAIGNQQSDIVIDGNSVSGDFIKSIYAQGARRLGLLNNKVAGIISAARCTDLIIAYNYAGKGMMVDANVGLTANTCSGPHSGRIVGTIVIPPGKMTQTATFQSLRLPDLPEGNYGMAITLGNLSAQQRGEIRARVTRTGIMVNVERPSSERGEISFQIEIH